MRLPQKKKPGDLIMAEDWNLLLDAIAARTPRPGNGLEFIASSGGFAYSAPAPASLDPVHPPFDVIGMGRYDDTPSIILKEGWVIERQPKTASSPVVKFHMPKYNGIQLDAVPRPKIEMAAGETLWCRYKTDTQGVISEPPEIIAAATDEGSRHYQPVDPEGSGTEGEYYVKLLRLDLVDGGMAVICYQRSDIEHYAQLWTGENVGAKSRIFKEHTEAENKYKFRTLDGTYPIKVEEDGDVIKISMQVWPPPPPVLDGEDGSLEFLDCNGYAIEGKKIEWANGLVQTAGDIQIKVPPCPPPGQEAAWYGGGGITGATGELIIRSDRPDLTYPNNIVGYVKAENGIVTEIFGDVTFCCHPSAP